MDAALRDRLIFDIKYRFRRFRPKPKFPGAPKWWDDDKIVDKLAAQIAEQLLQDGGLEIRLKPEQPIAPATFPECPRMDPA